MHHVAALDSFEDLDDEFFCKLLGQLDGILEVSVELVVVQPSLFAASFEVGSVLCLTSFFLLFLLSSLAAWSSSLFIRGCWLVTERLAI